MPGYIFLFFLQMLKKAAISFMSWVVFGRATTPLWLKWWCTVSWNCWRVTVMLSELWKDIIWHFKERRWYICSGPFRIKEGRRRGWEALKSCYYLVWSRWGGKKSILILQMLFLSSFREVVQILVLIFLLTSLLFLVKAVSNWFWTS